MIISIQVINQTKDIIELGGYKVKTGSENVDIQEADFEEDRLELAKKYNTAWEGNVLTIANVKAEKQKTSKDQNSNQ